MSCCCFDVDEASEIFAEKIRKARKSHICCECRKEIPKGAQYFYEKVFYDGKFEEFKTCLICKKIRDDYFSCGFYYETMWNDLYACWDTTRDVIGP